MRRFHGYDVLLVTLISFCIMLNACSKRKPGECEKDRHCEKMAKTKGELWACYKEPPDAQVGICMRAKDARLAYQRYKQKQSGKCEDQDQDGVKAGDACDPPIDCDDTDPAIRPQAIEVCDTKDNNCNEIINEGLPRCVGTLLGGKQDPVAQFMITMPAGVTVGPTGDVWLSDQHQIFRIKNHKAERYAGSNKPGNDNKKGTAARFDEPIGLAVDQTGNVFIAECRNNCIRKINPDRQVSTYAGLCSSAADDTGLDQDGPLDKARFWCPVALAMDGQGSLFVVDKNNSKIKRITKEGRVQTIAGAGGTEDENGLIVFGHKNGPAKTAQFNEPAGIARSPDGSIFIADYKNNCIRVIQNNKVKDYAGICAAGADKGGHKDGPSAKALFRRPQGLSLDSAGNLFVADTGNHCIRLIKNGKVTTVAGKVSQQGYYDGPIDEALFNEPWYIASAQNGTLFVVDHGNYRLRQLRLE